MTVPSREEAAALLLELKPAPRLLRHMTVVAEIAAFLAARAAEGGLELDRRAVETAALLHDLDKALRGKDPLRQMGHGFAGARWLEDHGYAELAPSVEWHPVVRLSDDAAYERFQAEATWEVRLVAYADKRAAQRLAPIGERFQRWARRHPEMKESLKQSRKRAALLEAEVCEACGVTPEQVRRLRWVTAAIERTRTTSRPA